jgi:hypothetical protein
LSAMLATGARRSPVHALATALLVAACVASVGVTSDARAATARACAPVLNPYPGTRFDGVDLRRIRAEAVSCRTARRVARRAHRKALGITPPPSGIRRFSWRRWQVTGDLRGSTDRYVARRGARRVRWVF